ncbi:MAG TPA: DUF5655 domain-containing protein [Candidatus Saccharimonadales bacterium]|nr:DUF5655 domain-containing protein [Candidatus Saccharimonadales bacterium]
MALFSIKGGELKPIKEEKFKLEHDLQSLTEHNLQQIFGLQFVTTEFERKNLRIDTLAFDPETNAFVVIEYKRDRSSSVVDQGFAYLALLLNNKAEFVLEYNERTGKRLQRDSVDWTQSRVLFLANSFTLHQQQAINFRDLPIELWEAKQYDNGTILYNELKAQDTSESIKTVSKSRTIQKVSSEVKVYTVADHFTLNRAVTLPLYESLRDKLLSMEPTLQENPRGAYIGMSLGDNGSNTIVYIHSQVGKLRLHIPRIRPEDVSDPLHKLRYDKGSFERKNTHESILTVESDEDVDYVVTILRQLQQKFFK